MVIMDSSSFMLFEKIIFLRWEGKVSWREDQERIPLFNPGLILLWGEGTYYCTWWIWFITPFNVVWHMFKAIYFSCFQKLPEILLGEGSLKKYILPAVKGLPVQVSPSNPVSTTNIISNATLYWTVISYFTSNFTENMSGRTRCICAYDTFD